MFEHVCFMYTSSCKGGIKHLRPAKRRCCRRRTMASSFTYVMRRAHLIWHRSRSDEFVTFSLDCTPLQLLLLLLSVAQLAFHYVASRYIRRRHISVRRRSVTDAVGSAGNLTTWWLRPRCERITRTMYRLIVSVYTVYTRPLIGSTNVIDDSNPNVKASPHNSQSVRASSPHSVT